MSEQIGTSPQPDQPSKSELPHDTEAVLDDVEAETDAKKILTPEEQKEWREWMDTLIKNGIKEGGSPVKSKEKPLFIDEIGFTDYLKTFEQVSRQYGLGLANPKIAAIEAGFLLKGIFDGLNPYRLMSWVWNAVDKQEHARWEGLESKDRPPITAISTFTHGERHQVEVPRLQAAYIKTQVPGPRGKKPQSVSDLHIEDKHMLAIDQLKQWSKSTLFVGLATLPLSILTHKASEALGDELFRVKESVNKRVADSLLMVDFEFSQSRNPAAMIGVVERGKMAIDTLISSTYRNFLPGTAALAAATIPLVKESPVTAALAVARGVMLLVTGKARLTEAILEGQAEVKRRGAMEGRVMAIMNGLELVKTDDTQAAAKELAEQLTARDKLIYGVGREQTGAEKIRERIGNVFSYGAPIVSVGWKTLMDRRKGVIENTQGRESSLGLQDFVSPAKWKKSWPDFVLRSNEYVLPIWNAYASQKIMDHTVNSLVGLYHGTLKGAVRDIRKMEEYLGNYDALDRPDGPRELVRISVDTLPNLSIKIENVAYKNILHEATLEIPEGSFIAIQGVSGEGKSTLLRQMLGLYQPEGGSVTYGGVSVGDIKKFGPESLYAKIAYAPQNPYYFPQMTIRENIKLWSRREVSDAHIRETLTNLRMEKFVGRLEERNLQFSGGELRRIGLARALVKNPKILFLDEPTSNLDPETSNTVIDIISGFRKTNPTMTVIAVTHDPRFGTIADRVVTMKEVDKPTEQVLVGEFDNTPHSIV